MWPWPGRGRARPLVVLGDRGLGRGLVGGLGGVVGALVVEGGGGEVAVFEGGEELASFYVGAALDVELSDRSGDLGGDGGLGEGRESGVGGDVLGDVADLRFFSLHVDLRSGSGIVGFLATLQQKGAEEKRAEKCASAGSFGG